jgi:hypothetical protein
VSITGTRVAPSVDGGVIWRATFGAGCAFIGGSPLNSMVSRSSTSRYSTLP